MIQILFKMTYFEFIWTIHISNPIIIFIVFKLTSGFENDGT